MVAQPALEVAVVEIQRSYCIIVKNKACDNLLLIFIKHPESGKVKTRLANDIGKDNAAYYYSLMSKYLLKNVHYSDKYETLIFYDPPDKKSEISKWLDIEDTMLHPQIGNDLGQRISNSISQALDLGYKKVVVIGSDCIDISKKLIEDVYESLIKYDVVVGPTFDGGYYLIGIKRYLPKIFTDIQWSTESVFKQTISIIEKLELKYYVLDKLGDIDTVIDLKDRDFMHKIQINFKGQ